MILGIIRNVINNLQFIYVVTEKIKINFKNILFPNTKHKMFISTNEDVYN